MTDLPKVTHTAEYTDRIGNTYRIEARLVDGMGSPLSGELVAKLWDLVTGIHAQAGFPGDPVAVLAGDEWHGAKFAEQFDKGEIDE